MERKAAKLYNYGTFSMGGQPHKLPSPPRCLILPPFSPYIHATGHVESGPSVAVTSLDSLEVDAVVHFAY